MAPQASDDAKRQVSPSHLVSSEQKFLPAVAPGYPPSYQVCLQDRWEPSAEAQRHSVCRSFRDSASPKPLSQCGWIQREQPRACSFQHQRGKSHLPLGFTQNPRGWAGGRTGRGRWGRQEAEGRAQPASRLLQDSQTRFWTQPTPTLTQTPTPSRAQTPRRPGFGVRCATLPLLNAPLHHLGWGRGAEVLRPQAPAEFLGSAGPRALEGHPPR